VHGPDPVAPRPISHRAGVADGLREDLLIDRRTFLAGTGAVLLAAPLAAEAQQARKVYRMGVLAGSPPTTPDAARPWEALMQALRELGYVEGQNLAVERRWADRRAERYHEMIAELVA
jgi:putative ABC transport system substrate-binding protein